MKLHLRKILLLVSLPVLGIFIFQGYWLLNTYRETKKQFYEKADITFQQALHADLNLRLKKDDKGNRQNFALPPALYLPNPRKGEKFQRQATPDKELTAGDSVYWGAPLSLNHPVYESLYRVMYRMLPVISINQIDSLWGIYLRRNGIYNAHFIDLTQTEDTLLYTTCSTTGTPDDIFPTYRFLISETSQQGVQGFLLQPELTVYKRMTSLFICSLMLILITMVSYFYLIRTILRQKSIAEIKNDFVNNMTHELKTPITVTYSAIDALQTFNLVDQKDKRDEYFSLCREQLMHLSGVVEKILSMAVDERRNFRLRPERFFLSPTLNNLVKQFRLKAGKPVHFTLRDELNGQPIVADKLHFSNALSNLLDNAIKYSPGEAFILIQACRKGGRILVSVTDRGMGIPPTQQEKIFERFYRISQGNVHDVKGFGLGLHYVRLIMEKHRGTVTVSSDGQSGSTFTLIIPDVT